MKIVQQLSKTDEIYFIGYSLPDADFISKYYFIKGLHRAGDRNNVKIMLINPNVKKEGLDVKFEKFMANVKPIINQTVESYMQYVPDEIKTDICREIHEKVNNKLSEYF